LLVIFDCDGVLVDSEPIANASFSTALKPHGIDWNVEETMRRLMGRSLKSAVEICEAEIGRKLPDDFVDKMQAVTYRNFRDAPLRPVAKTSVGKATVGGRKIAWRRLDDEGYAAAELLTTPGAPPPGAPPSPASPDQPGRPLQVRVIDGGAVVHRPTLDDIRKHHLAVRAELRPEWLLPDAGPPALIARSD